MLIAISGGIGSGKSVISRIVSLMGYEVYDCDSHAKLLMDTDKDMQERISREINSECVKDGNIDRKRLADIVFNDAESLQHLNSIVHSAVRADLKCWADTSSKIKFVETAILYQSELDKMVDVVWEIDAPIDLRVNRVMARNSITREEVLSRIASQDSFIPQYVHPRVTRIINDGILPVLPQIEAQLSYMIH